MVIVVYRYSGDCGISVEYFGDCGISVQYFGDCGISVHYIGDCGISVQYFGDCGISVVLCPAVFLPPFFFQMFNCLVDMLMT